VFSDTVSLDARLHRDLLFAANQPYHYCQMQVSTPVMAGEAYQVAREMPMLFSARSPSPMALLGVEAGQNLHVRPTGHWIGRYVPAHIRRYPFILAPLESPPGPTGEQAAAAPRFALKFARQAPHLRAGNRNGVRLFDGDGRPTEPLQRIQKAMVQMQKNALHTAELVRQLERYQLLVGRTLTVSPRKGVATKLEGFRVVDDKTFASLSAEALADLAATGALALIYAHHVSLTNLRDGVIAQMQSDSPATPDLDTLFGADNDDISFNFNS